MLTAFQLDNTDLGLCFSAYGLVALGSYFIGGPLADRFAPRKLMAMGLWGTAAGGLYMATVPSYSSLIYLYAYWGMTTILLFWAPMIKATRVWGGRQNQAKAFGLLDGGRGLVGALFGTLGVVVFSYLLPTEVEATITESRSALAQVIFVASTLVAVIGGLVWWLLRSEGSSTDEGPRRKITWSQVGEVLRLPAVWLLMVIILCAYTGYKVTDVFSLYAREVLGYEEAAAAGVGSLLLYVRPVVGISVGFLADRGRITFWLVLSFVLAIVGSALFGFGWVGASASTWFVVSTLLLATGVYAARALYFAVMEVGRIPLALTGTAVGLVSLVGYTPDIFAGPLMGYFLDGWPGELGLRYTFLLVGGFGLLGLSAAGVYGHLYGGDDDAGGGGAPAEPPPGSPPPRTTS